MNASWRKPVGMLALLGYLTVWVVIVASFSAEIARLPALVQLVVYLVAGIVWIAPLKPALMWMETGRWRVPR